MSEILSIYAREILDSRGFPTVEAEVLTASGIVARASVPSGASTGTFEALEKRDQDSKRYKGKGVWGCIEAINEQIAPALEGLTCLDQKEIDYTLISLDGTDNKSNLGANTTLAVSLACARAAAMYLNMPLYKYLGGSNSKYLPVPLVNVINGGVHADNELDIQEFMITPHGANDFAEAMQYTVEVFLTLKEILKKRGLNTNVGDEGGFAPQFTSVEETLDVLSEAVEKAGFNLGKDMSFALDAAANEFFDKGIYTLQKKAYDATSLIAYYQELCKKYPIVSIEDGLSEEDWAGWQQLTKVLGDKIQLVGDDLFVTNSLRLEKGIQQKCANAILIKLNQIGTLTETMDTIDLAYKNGYACVISHRSGETEDSFIADLAVGVGSRQIKTGSVCRAERTAKYNQLLRINELLGIHARYLDPFVRG